MQRSIVVATVTVATLVAAIGAHATGCTSDPGAPSPLGGTCNSLQQQCACSTKADCPSSTPCKIWDCVGGQCSWSPSIEPLDDVNMGDCKKPVCNMNGEEDSVADDLDRPVDSDPCTKDECVNGSPVEPHPSVCASDEMCYFEEGSIDPKCASCTDNLSNGTETGTDCGNEFCGLCPGEECMDDGQCALKHCAGGIDVPKRCCTSPCADQCMGCDGQGACVPLPKYASDKDSTPKCANTQACDGSGNCKLANNRDCTADANCASGKCKCWNEATSAYVACMANPLPGIIQLCKGQIGDNCSGDNDCVTDYCNTSVSPHVCAKAPNGSPCLDANDCQSNKCMSVGGNPKTCLQ